MTFTALVRDKSLDALELTWRQTAVLELLAGDFCGAGTSTLALELGVSRPCASRSVDRLVLRGLVHCAVDPHDRRLVRCTLTNAGIVAQGRIARVMRG